MSTSRPAKHERTASTPSRSPKRVKEGEEEGEDLESEMDWERIKREEQRRGKKRDNVEVDGSTEVGESDDNTVRGESIDKGKKSDKKESKSKSARMDNVDSPSSSLDNQKEKKKRREQLKLTGSAKGKGKRVIDDSEDREIGEEWTDLNGLRWKMGEDGQMRREAVVVEMRLKYPTMPKDSRHPDAKIKIAVLVERFLTEKEYEEARAKKLLSHQELERQREAGDAKELARKKQEEENEAKLKRVAEIDRQITTPKKIRDLQALFNSARKPSSPAKNSLPFATSRSRSLSLLSSQPSATSSPSSVKRLSLSMGSKDADAATTSPTKSVDPNTTIPQGPSQSIQTPLKSKVSYRLPLATSPSSPVTTNTIVKSRSSPIVDVTAKRKREADLLQLLQEEADRRKNRGRV